MQIHILIIYTFRIQYALRIVYLHVYAMHIRYMGDLRVYTWRFARKCEQRASASINNDDPSLFIAVILAHVSRLFTRSI